MGLRLPGGEFAIVEIEKLRDYCLSSTHPRGRHKARVFLAALGLTAEDAGELRDNLLLVARAGDALEGVSDEFGRRYVIEFEIERDGRVARIRSSWIVMHGQVAPRFVTCFVL